MCLLLAIVHTASSGCNERREFVILKLALFLLYNRVCMIGGSGATPSAQHWISTGMRVSLTILCRVQDRRGDAKRKAEVDSVSYEAARVCISMIS